MRLTGQVNEKGVKTSTNVETGGRYHSNWLSMTYPRLFLARNLLREDGVIFVSIDDNEVHNLRLIMNEIFGEENFQSVPYFLQLEYIKPSGNDTSGGYLCQKRIVKNQNFVTHEKYAFQNGVSALIAG